MNKADREQYVLHVRDILYNTEQFRNPDSITTDIVAYADGKTERHFTAKWFLFEGDVLYLSKRMYPRAHMIDLHHALNEIFKRSSIFDFSTKQAYLRNGDSFSINARWNYRFGKRTYWRFDITKRS